MSEWISVKDLPKTDIVCLVTNTKGWMHCVKAMYHSGYQVFTNYNRSIDETCTLEVTHYLPIPEPPNE